MPRILFKLRWPLLGLSATALIFFTSTALAGSGVGGVFNLGVSNSVNATTGLSGSNTGPQLSVTNTNTGAYPAIRGSSAATAANAFSIYALLSAAAPTGNTVAVRGLNSSQNAYGYGVWGSQSGAGTGVYGTAVTGTGVLGRHLASSGSGPGVEGLSASSSAAGVLGYNLAGGPGLQAIVSSSSVPPLTVNSSAQVANLNASYLGGHAPSYFLPAAGTAANSARLGGYPAATFYRLRTTPAGNMLTTLDSTGTVGQYTSATIGADGLPLISYYNVTSGDLKVAHCSDVSCTSATKTTIDSSGDVGQYSSITLGSDGLGLISYYDATNTHLKVAHCSNVACTSATTTTVDNGGGVGEYTSIAIGTDGFGLISYYDATNTHLKVAHCTNVTCSNSSTFTIDSTTNGSFGVGRHTSITIGADGLGLISYEDSTNGDLIKVAHCQDVACSTATANDIDLLPVASYESSITTGADGLGLITYWGWNGSQAFVRVAHCQTADCTSADLTYLDSSGNVGRYSSVTIGADGLGLISYYDAGNHHLKVAHCANVACTSASTTSLDSSGDVGQYTSITIGSDGLPLISYYDATNGDLKVVRCASTFCTPYFRRR